MAVDARSSVAAVAKEAAMAALAGTLLALGMLAVRAPYDWSHAFAVTWYFLLVAADVSGLIGLVSAAAGRWPSRRNRVLAAVVSTVPLLTTGTIVLLIIAALEAGVTE